MKVTITIDCDNAAFEDAFHLEVARILGELAEKLQGYAGSSSRRHGDTIKLRDINGNTVGRYEVSTEGDEE